MVVAPFDFAALSECAAALVGTHDFTAFTPSETYHQRFSRDVFSAFWRQAPGSYVLEFWIEADAFMRQMNRVLVGTMLEVGRGPAVGRGLCGAAVGAAAVGGRADRAGARSVPGRRGLRWRARVAGLRDGA